MRGTKVHFFISVIIKVPVLNILSAINKNTENNQRELVSRAGRGAADSGPIRSRAAIVVFVSLEDKLRSFKTKSLITLIHTKENDKKFV